ncbi:MAG: polysaccharide pyruvyl transferase family protein [Bacillota bacterium]|nr:polysaccharide pyruvyl transferase family protein [Bacillota bacterium]
MEKHTKVGIVTIISDNYGNRLQNYALNSVLNDLNIKAVTCKRKYYFTSKNNCKALVGSIMLFFYNYIPLTKKVINKSSLLSSIIRKSRFVQFNKKYIPFTNVVLEKSYSDIDQKCDYFICGSDQVWNPYYSFVSSFDFLSFTTSEKRISYAPSFGVDELPETVKGKYTKYISEFKSLSVREEAGKKIIKDIVGRDVPVVLDPTMLLTKNKWLQVCDDVKIPIPNKYLFVYLLGNLSDEEKSKIEHLGKTYNLKILYAYDKNYPEIYTAGPKEFLYYILNCTLLCTDSFHATVFSIIFNRPFIVFKREDKGHSLNSRIVSLLKLTNLEERLNVEIDNNNLLNCSFEYANSVINNERIKSIEYISKSLNDN